MEENNYFVYINTNVGNTVLYTGVTNDIGQRAWQHKNNNDKRSFTYRYNVNKLVYYELYDDINDALERKKQIKGGSRNKKIELIELINPNWRDLYEDL